MPFSPNIFIHPDVEYSSILISQLGETVPKEISISITENSQCELIKFQPKIQNLSEGEKVQKDLTEMPYIILYIFSSSSKNEFRNFVRPAYKKLCEIHSDSCCCIIPVFVNDPKKIKGKTFFSQTPFIQYLQSGLENLQVINLKITGKFQSSQIKKIWQNAIIPSITQSFQQKVQQFEASEGPSIKSIQNHFKLYLLLESNSFSDEKKRKILETIEWLIEDNQHLFEKYIEKNSLLESFDFYRESITLQNKVLTDENPTMYDLRFIVFKQKVQGFMISNEMHNAIECGFNFVKNSYYNLKREKQISDTELKVWLCQSLYYLITQCNKEKKLAKKLGLQTRFSMMEWYLEVLPEVFALEEKPKEYLDDSFLVQFYTKVVNSKENFLGEMKTVCLELIQAYLGSGYQRCAAVTIKKYSYLLENGQEYLAISLISLIKLNFPITQEITEEMLTKIPFDDRVKICCQILSSPNLKVSHKNAANQISKIFTDSKFTSKHVTSLPCIAHNEDNAQGYEVNKIVNIKLKLKCLFDSQIEVPYIEIGFIHMGDANDIVFFNTTNVKISDGSLLCVKGSFQKQGLYSPYCAKIGTEASHIYYTFPTLNPTIKVRTKPNVNALHSALYCHLVLPSVLLPAQWQTASLSIGVVKHLSSLQLFISGVTFKTAKLEDVNGTVYLPDDEFVFSELKPGTYLMDLPIMAYDSGTIDVSLQSGKDNIKYTKRYYVSDFLKMSVKYRKRTKVATLSAVGNSNLDINITNVIFYKGDDQISDCNIIGIPCKVSRNTTSAIFVLGSEPEYAHVWIEQDKLKPFLVKVNVELMEKEDLKNKNMIPQTPFTVVVPDDISSRLY